MSNETASSPDASTPVKDAPAPFSGVVDSDNDTRPADFILRSGDGVDFHVRKDMLQVLSDFFQGMFSMPKGSDHDDICRDGKVVLLLPESANVVYALLWIAYPRQAWSRNPLAESDIDSIADVHAAANKYQFLIVERLVKEMLEGPVLLDAHPHRLFAIARLRGLPVLAQKAALHTLRSPVSVYPLAFPEMDLLPWSTGQKLHDFHRQCGVAASKQVKKATIPTSTGSTSINFYLTNGETGDVFIWWSGLNFGVQDAHSAKCSPRSILKNGNEGVRRGRSTPVPWFRSHIEQLASQLLAYPAANTVEDKALKIAPTERAIIDGCDACSKHADSDLANFARRLTKDVEALNVELFERLL